MPEETPRSTPRPSRRVRTPNPDAEPEGAATPPPKRRAVSDRKVSESISGTYQSIGLVVIAAGMGKQDEGLLGTGQAIVEGSGAAAEAWMELADQNPAVKKALQRFSEGSAVASLVAVHLGMLMPLAASRGVLPPMFGATAAAAAAGGGMPTPDSPNGASV